jgi:hypothetical protein
MERYCSTLQSPQRAVTLTEEEEVVHLPSNVRNCVLYIAQCVVTLVPPLVAFIRAQTYWVMQAI